MKRSTDNSNASPKGTAKPRGKPFEPGKSGNPGGRPKKTEQLRRIEDLARQHSEDAILALVDEARNGGGAPRVSAAVAILDRGWGKPVDRQEAGKPGEFNDKATEEKELRERIKERSVKLGLAKVVPIGKRAE